MPARFATILTCIDGRIQRTLDDWARDHLAVDHLDVVTEPGADAVVASTDEEGLAVLLHKVRVSQRAHGSAALVVAGHSDCAGNPVTDDRHRQQLRHAAARLARRLPTTRILAVHTGQCGQECWEPHLVTEIAPSAGPAPAPSLPPE